ncbi:DUF2634 domain-containing protein [Chengkuizengella marina]|uniref:DUF2634 domain-containing protein n=1 Tax=Chengkuizengella marina TaxID=2507566 RepID=A0A6N9Q8H5_9BACL|nr:DUF2634 domain-containing protein [Chengkuizengella marina]NBI30914.1 DUF2634 domain-containing protein [Chengkuizengella marina]
MSLPKIAALEFEIKQTNEVESVHKTYVWDYETRDLKVVSGKLVEATKIEYVKEWCKKALSTIKYTSIYDNAEYGSEHHSLIGSTFKAEFLKSEIERMIKEALLQNNSITRVDSFSLSQSGSWLTISFSVHSIYGTLEQEVKI